MHVALRQRLASALSAIGLMGLTVVVQARADTLPPERVIEAWGASGAHPLTGRIWTARDGRVVDGVALARAPLSGSAIADAIGLRDAAYVLLGEIHDNAQHHLLRAGLIDDVAGRTAVGRISHPAIVSEHFRPEQAAALEEFRLSPAAHGADDATVSAFFEAVQWDKSGWPSRDIFRPLYAAAIRARLPIVAGDVSRERIRAAARGGIGALEPTEVERLGLGAPLPASLDAALAAEVKDSHCGMLPATAIPGMALAQRLRDSHLAAAMLEADQRSGRTILLAGNGHVRTDRGVPWHIRRARADAAIFSLMLIEVSGGRDDPHGYVPRDPDGRPAADAIVFTPRAPREDPCERMRAHMQSKG